MRRIFLDENVEEQLETALNGFEVQSVAKLKLKGIKNGALLRWLVENGYEVLIAKDKNIEHQNPLGKIGIAVVVVRGRGRIAPRFIKAPEELRTAVATVKNGQCVHVFAPD